MHQENNLARKGEFLTCLFGFFSPTKVNLIVLQCSVMCVSHSIPFTFFIQVFTTV